MAHALDLAGERWTLLIVRELLAGPRRYSDLAGGLVSVPTNVLASRLKQMEASGLLHRRRLDPPASSVVVYELTELGFELSESVVALARWGMRTLPPTREQRPFQSHWLVLALQACFRPHAASGLTESYEFRLDGDEVVHFEISDGQGAARVGAAINPALAIAASTDVFLELSAGVISPEQAIKRGARIDGTPAALRRMRAVLPPRGAVTNPDRTREGVST